MAKPSVPSTANGPERVFDPTPNPSQNGPYGNLRRAFGQIGSEGPNRVNIPATNIDAVDVMASALERVLALSLQRDANDVRQNLTEHHSAEYGTTSLAWTPETRDPWWLEGIMVVLPINQSGPALLQIGEYTIPIQNTTTILTPLRLMTYGQTRSLAWTTSSATVKATVTLWGRVAVWRGGAPGVGPIATPGRVL